MPDLERKFLRLEGVQHKAGCADAIGQPCDCGAEMFAAIDQAIGDIFTGPDAVGEEINTDALAEYPVVLAANTIRMLRQALANQRAREP